MQDGLLQRKISSKISQIALMPRLNSSIDMLDFVIGEVKSKKAQLRNLNHKICQDWVDREFNPKSIDEETQVTFALESLRQIQKRINSVTTIQSIPIILPSTIQVTRTISCQLFEILPHASQALADLSSRLGSILMDSGIITGAKFDFRLYNLESNTLLDEAKLMVDSKISKLYPNLEFLK